MEVGTGVQFTGEIRSCVTTSNLSVRTVKVMRMLPGFSSWRPNSLVTLAPVVCYSRVPQPREFTAARSGGPCFPAARRVRPPIAASPCKACSRSGRPGRREAGGAFTRRHLTARNLLASWGNGADASSGHGYPLSYLCSSSEELILLSTVLVSCCRRRALKGNGLVVNSI